jgi:hypothetical protein
MRYFLALSLLFLLQTQTASAQQADWQTPPSSDKQSEKSEKKQPIGSPRQVALHFVKHTGVNRNFVYILLHSTQTSPVVQSLYGQHPKETVDRAVRHGIQPVVRKYFEEWKINLAATYLDFFSAEQLHSLATLRTRSPYFQVFQAKSPEIAPAMRKRTGSLLNEATNEAIQIIIKSLN